MFRLRPGRRVRRALLVLVARPRPTLLSGGRGKRGQVRRKSFQSAPIAALGTKVPKSAPGVGLASMDEQRRSPWRWRASLRVSTGWAACWSSSSRCASSSSRAFGRRPVRCRPRGRGRGALPRFGDRRILAHRHRRRFWSTVRRPDSGTTTGAQRQVRPHPAFGVRKGSVTGDRWFSDTLACR